MTETIAQQLEQVENEMIMNELIEGRLQEVEAEYNKPLWERLGKVAFVGLTSMCFSFLLENLYDSQLTRWKERKKDVHIRTDV